MSKNNRHKNPDSAVCNNEHSNNYSGRTGFIPGRFSLIFLSAAMILAVIMTAGCTGSSAGDLSDNITPGAINKTAVSGSNATDDSGNITGTDNSPENSTGNATAVSADDLFGTEWILLSYKGSSGMMNNAEAELTSTLTFVNESILGGNSGCNSYSADYTAADKEFKTGIIALTAMYCTDATMQFENDYLERLQNGRYIEISAGKLLISDEDGNLTLIFLPFTLEGSSWELTSMNNGKGAVVSLPENTGITIEFSDGKASGNSGCNNYFSAYTMGEDFGIELSAIGSTKMYCDEDIMVYESAYLKNLESVSRYYFNGKSLTFRDDNNKNVMTFVKSG